MQPLVGDWGCLDELEVRVGRAGSQAVWAAAGCLCVHEGRQVGEKRMSLG